MKTKYIKFEAEFMFNGKGFLGIGKAKNKNDAWGIAFNDARSQAENWFLHFGITEIISEGWRTI